MSLDIKNWTYEGRKLAPPLTITRRLIAWPFFQVVRFLLAFVALLGWGIDEASEVLEATV
jgi:hypothetical protein